MKHKEPKIKVETDGHDLTINQLTINKLTLNVGQVLVKIDPSYYRPTEVDLLLGDPTKAKTQLGWQTEYDLKGLVEDMMRGDLGSSWLSVKS